MTTFVLGLSPEKRSKTAARQAKPDDIAGPKEVGFLSSQCESVLRVITSRVITKL